MGEELVLTGEKVWIWLAVGMLVACLSCGVLEGCGGGARSTGAHVARASAVRAERAVKHKRHSSTVGEFGKEGAGAGGLQEPFGIAVDQSSGDVYVVDSDHLRVEKFTSTGRFLLAWGWGVADGKAHKLQTCTKRCLPGLIGEGAGEFDFPEGVAVDNDRSSASHGDVYVVDIHNRRVEKFNSRGKFLLMLGGGVNHTRHRHLNHGEKDICPVRPGDVCGKGSEGEAAGQLSFYVECSCLAVAPNGALYVGQRNRVAVFSPEGHYLSQIKLVPEPKPRGESSEVGGVSGLAINAAGDLYVIRHNIVGVNEYAPSGKLLRLLEPGGEPAYPEGPTPALAVDTVGNVFIDVYSNYEHRIDEYNASGVKIASFDEGPKASPYIADKEDGLPGMAFDAKTNRLYLLNADVNVRPVVERVRVLKPPVP